MGFKKDHTESINIGEHTMTIGYRAYPLRNIVRVQALDLAPDRGIGRLFARLCVTVVTTFVAFLLAGAVGSQDFAFPVLLVGALIAAFFGRRLFKALMEKNTYAILIETNGTAIAVLGNKNPQEIERVYWALYRALEEGRRETISITTFNNIETQFNQTNNGSGRVIGQILNG